MDGLLLKVEITDSDGETFSTSVYCRSWAPELSEIKDSLNTKFSASQTEGNSRYKLISTAFGQLGSTGKIIGDTKSFTDWYREKVTTTGTWDDSTAWCGCFVSWCIDTQRTSLSDDPPKFATVDEGPSKFSNKYKHREEVSSNQIIPGDVIFFDTDKNTILDHTGIVLKVDDDMVYTIEGNRHKQVAFGTYELTDPIIIGYGQLEWNT